MSGDSRISGIDIIGNIPWGTHFCLFYQTKEDLIDILVPYFKAGLENNEFCIWITSKPLDVEEAKRALQMVVPDLDIYLEKGQIEIVPNIDFYTEEDISDYERILSGWMEKHNQALEDGYDGLRTGGKVFWSEKEVWENRIYDEEKADSIFGDYHIIALCTHSLDWFEVAKIAEIVSNHQFSLAKKDENWQKIVNSGRKRAEETEAKLKKIEEGLAEAQKLAHIGSWERIIAINKSRWSDELYCLFGHKPQEFEAAYDLFLSYVHPDDRDYVDNAVKRAMIGNPFGIDFRIISANGEKRTVHSKGEVVFDKKNNPILIRGTTQDITERKKAEEYMAKMDQIRIKEIHHRIKNNLQVISSLLDLQAEKFSNSEICKSSEVLDAFNKSKNRVLSIALIHEELYKGNDIDTLDFAAYLKYLTSQLFESYNFGNNDNISLKLNLVQVYLNMDIAIPLGIIVNELVTNSFKYAFPAGRAGEIQINLHKAETTPAKNDISSPDEDCMEKDSFDYILEVSDNGKGIPEEIDIENSNSLGLQLVNILVEQIDGCLELKSDNGTEFTIWFNNIET